MISSRFQVIALMICLIYFAGIFNFLKKKYFKLRYALIWLAIGLAMLIMAVFPHLLSRFAELLGIYSAENALFTVLFICVVAILITLTIIVSRQSEKVKSLTQKLALVEKRLRELEDNYN